MSSITRYLSYESIYCFLFVMYWLWVVLESRKNIQIEKESASNSNEEIIKNIVLFIDISIEKIRSNCIVSFR